MNRRSKFVYFLTGVLVTLFVFQSGIVQYVYGLAAQHLTAYRGVKVYVDGLLLSTTNVNGDWVDSYVIDGTTYVPARSIGEAMGKSVRWAASEGSVYIDSRNSVPAEALIEMPYTSQTGNAQVQSLDLDVSGRSHYNCFTSVGWSRTYSLGGTAAYLTGNIYKRYDYRDYAVKSGTTVSIYGDGNLLYRERVTADTSEYELTGIYVDLTGIRELTVSADGVEDIFALALGDMTVYYY